MRTFKLGKFNTINYFSACGYLPKILSIRIAKISVYIASIVILSAYSVSLVSFLTIDIPKIPFKDLKSFAQDGSYKLAPFYSPLTVANFKVSNFPLINYLNALCL